MKELFLELNRNIVLIDNYLYPRAIQIEGMEGIVYPMNSTGILMLSLCDGTHTISEIIEYVAEKYNVNKEIVEKDAKIFFEQKIEQNIVKYNDKCNKKEIDFRGKDNIILPYQLSIETTNQCQLKCKHCYNKSGIRRDNELSTDELIDILEQYKKLGGVSVMLTGGELFLKEGVIKLIDYVARNFLRVVILTNGYYIKDDIFNKLQEYKDDIAIQISIDGLSNNHDFIRGVTGAYYNSISNIKKLVKAGITVSVAFTLNEKNRNDIYELTKLVKEIGCVSINIGAVSSIGRAQETNISSVNSIYDLENLIQRVRELYEDDTFRIGEKIENFDDDKQEIDSILYDNKCGAGYKILHIFSDGKIGLCPSHGSIVDKFCIGNLRENTFEEILNYNNMKKVLNIPNPSKKLCGECVLYDECAQCIITMLNRSADECILMRRLYEEQIIDMQK